MELVDKGSIFKQLRSNLNPKELTMTWLIGIGTPILSVLMLLCTIYYIWIRREGQTTLPSGEDVTLSPRMLREMAIKTFVGMLLILIIVNALNYYFILSPMLPPLPPGNIEALEANITLLASMVVLFFLPHP